MSPQTAPNPISLLLDIRKNSNEKKNIHQLCTDTIPHTIEVSDNIIVEHQAKPVDE